MRSTINLLTLAQAAIGFTKAVADTAHCKDALKAGYHAWRVENRNFDDIERRSPEWDSMMAATADEYRELQNAKSRERKAKYRLLAMAKQWEGA